jgi:Tol biopolymer transport system component
VYFRSKHFPDNQFLGGMWFADADGNDARCLAATGDVFSARWWPDGTKISYTKEQEPEGAPLSIYVVDVTTGEIARVLENAHDWPEWVDDHTWIIGVD